MKETTQTWGLCVCVLERVFELMNVAENGEPDDDP